MVEYTSADEVETALRDLETLTDGRAISPLFARLALDLRRDGHSIPDSYPHLVQEYVDRLRPRGPGALRRDDFLRAARLTAFTCVEDELAPRQVSSEYLRGVLKAQTLPFSAETPDATEVQAASVLDQLVQGGLLDE